MGKAFLIKGIALALGSALALVLPAAWIAPAVLGLVLSTIALLAFHITHPASRFFVPVMSRLPTREPVVALTFDDGPDPVFTPRILEVLARHDARATFFVLGARAEQHPGLLRQIWDAGHTVGTHTQHHRLRFHFGTPSYVREEIEAAVRVVERILGRRPWWFRPPQGLRTPCFAAGWRRTSRLLCVTWTGRALDSRPTSADAIVARLARRLGPGAILTLHDGTGLGGGYDRGPTIAALERLLIECRQRGLRCVALDEVDAGQGAA